MILRQKLQVHSQVYLHGKLLNLEKAPGRQVISVLFPKKDDRKWYEMTWNGKRETRKCDNEATVEPYTGWTNQRAKDAISAGPTKQKDAISDDHTW